MNKHALIVGGGIGGLCSAIALQRIGWTVTVLERALEIREMGAAVQTWPNASNAMQKLGILDNFDAIAEEIVEGQICTRWGEPMISMHIPKIKEATGFKGYSIHRHEFITMLMEQLGEGCEVVLDASFTHFTQDTNGVVVHLEDGRSFEGGLLIGADGIRSKVREQAQPAHVPANQPRYAGYTAWRGLLDWAYHKRFKGYFGINVGRGGNVGYYPMTKDRSYWFVTLNRPEGEAHDPERAKAEILEYVRGWGDPIPELIERTPAENILRNDIYDLMPTDTWGTGCVTLVGDAAHATTPNIGQGACMAVEDAVALGAKVAQASHPYCLVAVLREYEQERYERTHWIVTRSRQIGEIVQMDSFAKELVRDFVLKTLPPNLISNQTRNIYLHPSPELPATVAA